MRRAPRSGYLTGFEKNSHQTNLQNQGYLYSTLIRPMLVGHRRQRRSACKKIGISAGHPKILTQLTTLLSLLIRQQKSRKSTLFSQKIRKICALQYSAWRRYELLFEIHHWNKRLQFRISLSHYSFGFFFSFLYFIPYSLDFIFFCSILRIR